MSSRPATRTRRREDARAAAVIVALTLVFFAPLVFGGRTYTTVAEMEAFVLPWAVDPAIPSAEFPAGGDQAVLSHPWHAAYVAAMEEPTLPYWDKAFGGFPLFSNGASGLLYPPRAALAWMGLSPFLAHDLMSAFHVAAAGYLMYLFLRRLGVRWWGGLFGGATWMLCGFNLAWLHFEVLSPFMVLLPLGMLAARRAHDLARWSAWVVLGAVLAVTFVSGQILFAALTATVVGGYAGCLALRRAWDDRTVRPLVGAALAGVVGLGLSAVVTVPTFVNLSSSNRVATDFDELDDDWITGEPLLIAPSDLLAAVVPSTEGLTIAAINNRMIFVGTLTVGLAAIGATRRRAGTGLGRVLVVVVIAVGVGGPVTWLAYHGFPLLQYFRPYGRALGVASFGIVTLAAIGLDELVELLSGREHPRPTEPRSRRPSAATATAAAVLAATVGQLLVFGRAVNPGFAPRGDLFEETALVEELEAVQRDLEWPARAATIAPPERVFAPIGFNLQALFDVRLLDGYDSAVPERAATMARYLQGLPADVAAEPLTVPLVTVNRAPTLRYELLERLGVRALITGPTEGVEVIESYGAEGEGREGLRYSARYEGEDGTIVGLVGVPAHAIHFVRAVEFVDSPDTAFSRFVEPRFDWRNRFVVDESDWPDDLPRPGAPSSGDRSDDVALSRVRAGTNEARFIVEADAPGFVVVPENWDRGWSATVASEDAPVLRVNYNQQAIPVPAGRSAVELRYRPDGLGLGSRISLVTLLLAGAVAAVDHWRHRPVGRHLRVRRVR